MKPTLTVNLGARSYPVFIGDHGGTGFAAALGECLGKRPVAVVTNTTLSRLCKEQLARWRDDLNCALCVIEDGEQYKTIATWETILTSLLQAGLDRRACVVAFGGGVVGDMAGFAAAAFLRGVDYVQVPTTLLAMVDSSVGGKTAVDHPLGKNLIGAFHQPRMVWIDSSYLNTLPARELVSGYAEIFKNAFIAGRAMFDFIVARHAGMVAGERAALNEGIEKSVRFKAGIVEADEQETGGARALLNIGHTFAHAIERACNYSGVLHGEAVHWGVACACDLARRTGTLAAGTESDFARILALLPRPPLPRLPAAAQIYESMATDKKARAGKLRFVLPVRPGESVICDDIDKSAVLATLEAVLPKA